MEEVSYLDDEKPGGNEVEESLDKEVDLEESSSVGSLAEIEELEAGASLHLTAAAGTAGCLFIFTFIAFDFKAFVRVSCSTEQATTIPFP